MRGILFFTILLVLPVATAADVTAFLSPDNSYSTLEGFLDDANELRIASYTFDSLEIAKKLIELDSNITVLLEANPVGGLKKKDILCELEKNGIDVYLYDGSARFMHAKYIIKDNEVLLTTENFGLSGFPANCYGNRGWGVIVKNGVASDFMEIFEYDLKDATRFNCEIADYVVNYGENEICESETAPVTYENQAVRPIFAPDAVNDVLDLLNSSQKSIYIEQFYIYRYWNKQTQSPNLFLEAAIDKARQGLDVKILLDSYWYNVEEDDVNSNLNTAAYINEVAEAENLSLEARLADLDGIGVEKLHLKGIIIDNNTVFVSSINWNENSPRNNREIGVVIEGETSEYFVNVFMNDWEGRKESIETEDTTGKSDFTLIYLVILGLIGFFLLVWKRIR